MLPSLRPFLLCAVFLLWPALHAAHGAPLTLTFGLSPTLAEEMKALQIISDDITTTTESLMGAQIYLLPQATSLSGKNSGLDLYDIVVMPADARPAQGFFVATLAYKTAYVLVPEKSSALTLKDLQGKKIGTFSADPNQTLKNIFRAYRIPFNRKKIIRMGTQKSLVTSTGCRKLGVDALFIATQPDSLLLYTMITQCRLRPIPLSLPEDSKDMKYKHYREESIQGKTFGMQWPDIPTFSVPYVAMASTKTYDFKVGAFLNALLKKSVPTDTYFLSVGSDPLDFVTNVTDQPDHQATLTYRNLLTKAQSASSSDSFSDITSTPLAPLAPPSDVPALTSAKTSLLKVGALSKSPATPLSDKKALPGTPLKTNDALKGAAA